MATVYKVLGQNSPVATTLTTLYTTPALTSTVVSTIAICNRSSGSSTFRIAIRPGGATIANQHYLNYDTTVPPNDTIIYKGNIGDELEVLKRDFYAKEGIKHWTGEW